MFSRFNFWLMLLRLHVARARGCSLPDVAPAVWYLWPEPLQNAYIARYFDALDAEQMSRAWGLG